jgi:hypothetical protein
MEDTAKERGRQKDKNVLMEIKEKSDIEVKIDDCHKNHHCCSVIS